MIVARVRSIGMHFSALYMSNEGSSYTFGMPAKECRIWPQFVIFCYPLEISMFYKQRLAAQLYDGFTLLLMHAATAIMVL